MTRVMCVDDSQSFEEAQGKPKWEAAMKGVYDYLKKNQTWKLSPFPKGKTITGCKWVYKTKFIYEGEIEKHKSRLAMKVFLQKEGIHYIKHFLLE